MPLGGCCYQMLSGNVPGSNIPYQQPARSHSAPANYSRTASPATKSVPPGASFGGHANVKSPPAAPSRFSFLNTHPSICQLGKVAAPPGGCDNQALRGEKSYVEQKLRLGPLPPNPRWPRLAAVAIMYQATCLELTSSISN